VFLIFRVFERKNTALTQKTIEEIVGQYLIQSLLFGTIFCPKIIHRNVFIHSTNYYCEYNRYTGHRNKKFPI
ncbi:hypothetical protein OAB57_04020, partial [Bacteriovoracaceae bacterium]|nr:hypothetical protein [Bacteriovoracaceae bacterium]